MTFSCILISRRVLKHAGLTKSTRVKKFPVRDCKDYKEISSEISQPWKFCQSGMIEDPPGNQNLAKGHIL